MKSMTGYGKANINKYDIYLEIEIKSVNSKYLDLRTYLPRELNFFETTVRKQVANTLSRGAIELRVNYNDHREPKLALNKHKLEKYRQLIEEASQILHVETKVSLEAILKEPGIMESTNDCTEDMQLIEVLETCLDKCLRNVEVTMIAEAEAMKSLFSRSIDVIAASLSEIEAQIEPYRKDLFSNYLSRIQELLGSFQISNIEQRIMQELAIYIDKYDIHEEISRLSSHITTFRQLLSTDSSKDVGKTLNFVLQEMQREANTLGSKFSTPESFPFVLKIKEEVEKCREVALNVA